MDNDSDDNDHHIFDGDEYGSDDGGDDVYVRSPTSAEQQWLNDLDCVRGKYSSTTMLYGKGEYNSIQVMTDEDWEGLGRDISNNENLLHLCLYDGALNDHKVSSLFRELTRSSSIEQVRLDHSGLSAAAIRSMVPFLQNTNNLKHLDLSDNNLQSEGFNLLFRALCDSPVERLCCNGCGIQSIEIDIEQNPKNLDCLYLTNNNITADGCRELAKLLREEDSALTTLYLDKNEIDDNGVEILVDALQSNTSLTQLYLQENEGISKRGHIMLLKLVNNITSIKATLQSNHSFFIIYISDREFRQSHIEPILDFNMEHENDPEEAGRQKIIQTQLHSQTRAELCRLQGVDHCVFSEIDPLHLPEVLSLIGKKHGQGELYVALLSSIMPLFSTMNREGCIQQKKEYHTAKAAEYEALAAEHRAKEVELENELAAMRDSAGVTEDTVASQSSKRRRT